MKAALKQFLSSLAKVAMHYVWLFLTFKKSKNSKMSAKQIFALGIKMFHTHFLLSLLRLLALQISPLGFLCVQYEAVASIICILLLFTIYFYSTRRQSAAAIFPLVAVTAARIDVIVQFIFHIPLHLLHIQNHRTHRLTNEPFMPVRRTLLPPFVYRYIFVWLCWFAQSLCARLRRYCCHEANFI